MREARLTALKQAVRDDVRKCDTRFFAFTVRDAEGAEVLRNSLCQSRIVAACFPDGEYARGMELWETDKVTGEARELLLTL